MSAPTQPGTLGALLVRHATASPEKPMITRVDAGSEASLTYEAAVRDGRALAGWLEREAGLGPGDRVALLLDNASVLEFFTTLAACWLGGFVAVPVNARNAPPEVAHVVEHSGARVVVSATSFSDVLDTAGRLAPIQRLLLVDDGSPSGFEGALAAGHEPQLPPPGADDPCAILYTSGTTGRPKGALFLHRGCVANAEILREALRIGPDSRMMLAVPVYTSTGTHTFPLPHLAAGATLLFETTFDPSAWLERARRTSPTSYFGVPAMLALLLDSVGDDAIGEIDSVREILFGGSPMLPPLAERLLRAFAGAGLRNVYGMTESGPSGTTLHPEEAAAKLATVGRAMDGVELRVVDEAGTSVAPGVVGEILLRTAGRMEQYLDNPTATAATIDEAGWLHTGDLGRLDDEGFLSVVDRANDTIVRGGFNVYPAEVEGALAEHPAVLEAAVAGKAHPVLGEDVVAWVVLRDGSTASADELRDHCRPLISNYKCPRDLRIVEALPRNAMGKLLRRELRDLTRSTPTPEAR